MEKKLHLSAYNKKIAGVCGGIAEYTGMDAALVRIIWVLLTLLFRGIPVLVYVLCWAAFPKDRTV